MKHSPIALLVLILTCLTAACKHDLNPFYLNKANEAVGQGRIDSLRYYLNHVDTATLQGEDRYTYQRLQFFFSRTAYTEQERFRIADELAAHYRQRKDSLALAQMNPVYFELYIDKQNYAQADSLIEVLYANDVRQGNPEAALHHYNRKAYRYNAAGEVDSALFYLNQCLNGGLPDDRRSACIARMGTLLMKDGRTDEGRAMLDSAICLAVKDSAFYQAYTLHIRYADLLAKQGQPAEALEKLKESRPYRQRSEAATYIYKAHFHELMHQEDSAAHYYEMVARIGNAHFATEANLRLAYLNELRGADSTALHKHQSAVYHIDHIITGYKRDAESTRLFQLRLKSEIDKLEIARQRQIIVSLSLAFALLVSFGGFAFYHQRKKRKEAERVARLENERLMQENRLLKQAEELSLIKEKASQLREELMRRMDIFKKLPSLDEDTDEGKASNRLIHLTEEDWREISLIVDTNFDNFTQRLRKEFPVLTTADVHFCCLVKINVSMRDLSNIYCISRGSVTKRKTRMKEKLGIQALEGVSLDEFIQRF